MARPEPNIFSQKCGNACTGALASTVISCAAAGESSRGEDSREVTRSSRMVATAKQRHNFFIRLLSLMSTRRVPVKSCQRESFPRCGELVGRLPPYTNGGARVKRLRKGLEAEASSQRDGTGGKSRSGPAEARGVNVVHDAIRFEVQIIEHVIGINSELNLSVFAEHRDVRQAKGLGQRHIHVLVSRPGERVATYAGLGKRGSRVGAAVGSEGWRREIRRATVGIIRTSLECIVAGAGARAAQVGSREKLRITASSAIEAS